MSVFFEAIVNCFTVKAVTKRLVPADAEYAAEPSVESEGSVFTVLLPA